jgi:hypothetical protein
MARDDTARDPDTERARLDERSHARLAAVTAGSSGPGEFSVPADDLQTPASGDARRVGATSEGRDGE